MCVTNHKIRFEMREGFNIFEVDGDVYPRVFTILFKQKANLVWLTQQLGRANNKAPSRIITEMIELAKSLIQCSYADLFTTTTNILRRCQELFTEKDITNEEKNFANSILKFTYTISRIFSQNSSKIQNSKADSEYHVLEEEESEQEVDENECVLCRICEQLIPIKLLHAHNQSCLKAYESEFNMITTDEKIRKLQNFISKTTLDIPWPGEKEKAITTILPIFHCLLLLDHALNGESDTIDHVYNTIKFIRVPSEDHILTRARNLVLEKMKAAQNYAEASQRSQMTRLRKTDFGVPSLQTTIADFTFIKRISSGAYAKVYLAEKNSTKDTYAIKVTPKSELRQKNEVRRVLTEKDILLKNSNPYIVEIYYSIIGKHNLYLVMDFVPGGDLYSLLQNIGTLDEDSSRIYIAQIVQALDFLHGKGILHRDLKPDNILISCEGKLKLTDFGLSLYGAFDRGNSEGLVGTPGYMAPEIILSQPHNQCVDYWSLGVILFELLTGIPPFNRETEQETFQAIVSGKCDWSLLEDVSNDGIDFIRKLLTVDPSKRLGANGISDIKNHSWFKSINWDKVEELPPPFVPKVTRNSTEYFEERYEFLKSDVIEKDIIEDIEDARKVVPRSVSMTDLSKQQSFMRNSDSDSSDDSEIIELYQSISLKNLSRKSTNAVKTRRISSKSEDKTFYKLGTSNSFCLPPPIPTK